MGIVHEPAPLHTCQPPRDTAVGTVWKCDDCGQLWRNERPWERVAEVAKGGYVSMASSTMLIGIGMILVVAVAWTIVFAIVGANE